MALHEQWAPPPVDVRLAIGVVEAGKLLGLGRQAAYKAARAGELPTLRIGRKLIVPLVALERLLASAGAGAGASR